MRIHTVIALYVLFFLKFFSITQERCILVLLTISSVIASEMFNTSIEKLADFCSYEYNSVIRIIKDVAAGAVVCCAAFSIIIGIIVFGDIEKIIYIIKYYSINPLELFLLVLSILISFLYIFIEPVKIKSLFYKLKYKG